MTYELRQRNIIYTIHRGEDTSSRIIDNIFMMQMNLFKNEKYLRYRLFYMRLISQFSVCIIQTIVNLFY